jgi:serpin B
VLSVSLVAPALLLVALALVVGPSNWLGPSAPAADKQALVGAQNQFAFDLYGRLRERPGNLFFSPHSISTALTMAWAGARGETASQMAAVLHLPADRLAQPDWVHTASAALLWDLRKAGNAKGGELSCANALWGQQSLEFRPEFQLLLDSTYGAGLRKVDFMSHPDQACRVINEWVAEVTRGKITDLAGPGDVGFDTMLMLASAVYFKGEWERPFRREENETDWFYPGDEKPVRVTMMLQVGAFKIAQLEDLQALEMPYRGGAMAMLFILPRQKDGLSVLEKRLSPAILQDCVSELKEEKELPVIIPKFKKTFAFTLADALSAAGMPLAFQHGANFGGAVSGATGLHLNAVVHKTYISVDELGTEAAAATSSAAASCIYDVCFRANHPFLFLIRDTRSGAILFMGRVVNPRE